MPEANDSDTPDYAGAEECARRTEPQVSTLREKLEAVRVEIPLESWEAEDEAAELRQAQREHRIEHFANQNRLTRERISLADIADYCAREGQPYARPDEAKRILAYEELASAARAGEFDDETGLRIRFLHPRFRWGMLTRERFAELHKLPAETMVQNYWRWCWISNAMAQAFFTRRARPVPEWLMPGPRSAGPQSEPAQKARSSSEPGNGSTPQIKGDGRPSNRALIFATLDDLRKEGHRVDDMEAIKLAKLIAKRRGVTLGDKGWARRTVLAHIQGWRTGQT
jgi:hypothetical protein